MISNVGLSALHEIYKIYKKDKQTHTHPVGNNCCMTVLFGSFGKLPLN